MSLEILVVDDEADIRDLVSDMLEDEGFIARKARNSEDALDEMANKVPAAVILDIWLKDSLLDGLGILEAIQRKYPEVPVVMISGHGTIETAVSSLKMGAYDYLEKPFKQEKLLRTLKMALEHAQLKRENEKLRKASDAINILLGDSAAVVQLRQSIDKVAPTNSRIFLTGPAGCGKETIARIIHSKSKRGKQPFISLNAGSLSSDMMDHELFGTEDDRDINAGPRKIGVLEQAAGGTLFIDEITDLPMPTQNKLLRVLQDGKFERIGANEPMQVDVRVISATRKDVKEAIRSGQLREDLYYRLSVVPLELCSLSERKDDIPMLCDYFLAHAAEHSKLPRRSLADDAIAAMQSYDWPGNIRQLRNTIEWLLIMSPGAADEPISYNMLPKDIGSGSPASVMSEMKNDIMALPLRQAREIFERQYLLSQINRFGGNISRTASFIGMERSALHRKLKSLKVSNEDKVA